MTLDKGNNASTSVEDIDILSNIRTNMGSRLEMKDGRTLCTAWMGYNCQHNGMGRTTYNSN